MEASSHDHLCISCCIKELQGAPRFQPLQLGLHAPHLHPLPPDLSLPLPTNSSDLLPLDPLHRLHVCFLDRASCNPRIYDLLDFCQGVIKVLPADHVVQDSWRGSERGRELIC